MGAILVVGAGGYFAGTRQHQRAAGTASGHAGFQPTKTELGAHLWDSVIPFTLTFVNNTSGGITVSNLTASCDCTVIDIASYRGKAVVPGSSIEIPGTLSSGKHAGSFMRTVTLISDKDAQFKAHLLLDVVGTWSVSSDKLDFGEFAFGDARSVTPEQLLTFQSTEDDLVGEPSADVPWVNCVVSRGDGEKTDILVTVVPERLAPGINTGSLTLRTTSSIRPDTSIALRVVAVPALVATPPAVFLTGDKPKTIYIKDRGAQVPQVLTVELSSPSVTARVIAPGTIEVVNVTGSRIKDVITLTIADDLGRSTKVTVNAF